MKTTKIGNLIHSLKIKAIKNHPQTTGILTGISMACSLSSPILSAMATSESIDKIRELKERDARWIDYVKEIGPNYILTMVVTGTGIACSGSSQSINITTNTVAGAAYTIVRDNFKDYVATVKEEVGEKKEKIISEKTSQKRIDRYPVNEELIMQTGTGNYLCKDEYYERWFRSSQQSIMNKVLYLNDLLQNNGMDEVTLNDLYTELGVQNMRVADYIGWSALAGDRIDISFDSCIADSGEPCLLIRHNAKPLYRSDHELSSPDVMWVHE